MIVNIFSACSRETACSGCQPSPRFAFDAFAGDRGVKLDHRFATLDRRIGTAADDGARFEQTLPGIRAGETIHPEPAGAKNKSLIACDGCIEGMTPSFAKRGISAGSESAHARRASAVREFFARRRDGFERLFVKIENQSIGAIADRVRFDLNAAAQRFFEHRPQLLWFLREKTGRVGRRPHKASSKAAPREPSAPSKITLIVR